MRKQDQLNVLITNMSKSEKRYFKLHASLHSGDKTFKRLFDELVKGNIYEPEALSRRLKISKPLLAHTKKYLEKVLLDSLRIYKQDSDPAMWLNNRWQEVKVLQDRKEYELALSISEKALEKALAYENFMMAYNFLDLRYRLQLFLKQVEEAEETIQQKILCLYQINEIEELSNMAASLNKISKGGRDTENLFKKTLTKAVFKKGAEKLKSKSAQIKWHEIKHNYYFHIKHDRKNSVQQTLNKLHIFETHPQLIYTWPEAYLNCFFYLTIEQSPLNAGEGLKFAKRLEFETDGHRKDLPANLRDYYHLTSLSIQVDLLNYQQKYAEVIKKVADIGPRLSELTEQRWGIVKFYHAKALFYIGKYDEALKICDEIQAAVINTNALLSANVLLLFTVKLFIVFIHHALKNYGLLEHLIRSAVSWAKRYEIKARGSNEVIRCLRKLAKTPVDQQELFFRKVSQDYDDFKFKWCGNDLHINRWVQLNMAGKPTLNTPPPQALTISREERLFVNEKTS